MFDTLLDLIGQWAVNFATDSASDRRRAWLILLAVLATLAGVATLVYFMYQR
ncbi:MAG: hypothetical protein IT432_01100 [Phycisphaerales bacterium]|nr:hypothetical protein [Phycisphaerales bacterium]